MNKVFFYLCFICLPQSYILGQTLVEYRSVRGVVEDENGKPVKGVRVRFNHPVYMSQVETKEDGTFLFEKIGSELDLGVEYPFSFRRSGYEPKDITRLLNDSKKIELKHSRTGYVLVQDSESGKYLEGIPAGVPDRAIVCEPSDQFGTIRIEIPPSYQDDKEIGITIKGGIVYRDTTIRRTVGTLLRESLIEISLKPAKKNYTAIKNDLNRNWKAIADKPDDTLAIEQFLHLYDFLQQMKLSSAEREEWKQLSSRYQDKYEWFKTVANPISRGIIEERKRQRSALDRLWDKAELERKPVEQFRYYDDLFRMGLNLLDMDLRIYELIGSVVYFQHDIKETGQLLEDEKGYLEEGKKKKRITEEYYNARYDKIIEKTDQLTRRVSKF